MKFSLEVRRSIGDPPNQLERRQEREIAWDEGADGYVDEFFTFLVGQTFAPSTILEAFTDFVENHNDLSNFPDEKSDSEDD